MARSGPEAPEAAPSNQTMTTTRLSLSIFSYNANVMLAAVISLLLVILFLLLLHIYAKWFLLRARRRRIRHQGSPLTGFLRGFHHFQTFSGFDATAACPSKGLDPSLIASIPIFLYKHNPAGFRDDENDRIRRDLGLECVICLSNFEEDDIGRALAKCGHTFHVECIDMWLHSHTTCPICRSPAVYVFDSSQETGNGDAASRESIRDEIGTLREWETVIDVEEDYNNSTDGEEEEAVSVVMDVFIVSVSVSRAGSA